MSRNRASIKPILSADISSKIKVQPLNQNTNLDILNNHHDDASDNTNLDILNNPHDDACNNKTLVKQLIKKRRQLNKDIQNMHKLISQHKKTIKKIECDLWKNCQHEWIYDQWANFDDRTKYLCKTCRCYRNERWYSK
jgi:hypothetical protein